jgi:hypothetical protein
VAKNTGLIMKLLLACVLMGGATYGIHFAGLHIIPVIVIGGAVYFLSLKFTGVNIRSVLR